MTKISNKQLSETEAKSYKEVKTSNLLLTSSGLLFLIISDNWTIKLIAFGVLVFSATFLLYKQKKLRQFSDFRINLGFVVSSIFMVLVLFVMDRII